MTTPSTPLNHSNDKYIVVIGYNEYGDLGRNHTNNIHQLEYSINRKQISSIHCGYRFYIYRDHMGNYYASGANKCGECGINDTAKGKISKKTKLKFDANQKIKKIFTSTRGSATFWLTQQNQIYAHGSNYFCKLGASKENTNYMEPHLITTPITAKEEVIDIQTAFGYSLILCHNVIDTSLTVWGWMRGQNGLMIPNDICALIHMFYGIQSSVYATLKSGDGGNGLGREATKMGTALESNHKMFWRPISTLEQAQIVQIRTGFHLFITLSCE